jgi:hypothetical protein
MVGQWNAENLLLYAEDRFTWTIVSGTGTYTVGTGGTVNTPRPMFITGIRFQDTSPTLTTEYSLEELTQQGYQGLVLKTLTAPFPTAYNYDATMPLGTLILWPTPTRTTLQGVMYSAQVVPAFATLPTTVVLPPGYEEMIVTNLALRLCGPYTKPVDPSLRERAQEAKAIAKRSNQELLDMSFEAGTLVGNDGPWNSFSIYTGP